MQFWTVFAALLVTGITSVSLVLGKEVKRQTNSVEYEVGPNNEILLVDRDGDTLVYLRGFNATEYDVGNEPIVAVLPLIDIGMGRLIIENIFLYNQIATTVNQGPGKLFVSSGPNGVRRAFFTDLLDEIEQILAEAPPPTVTVEIRTVVDDGDTLLQVVVGEEFSMVVTGQSTVTIRAFDSISYSGGTLTARGESFDNIEKFSVIDSRSDGNAVNTIFSSSQQTIVQGPGQLFVGPISALFIEKGNISSRVNREIVTSTLIFKEIDDGRMVVIEDIMLNPLLALTSVTYRVKLQDTVNVTYSSLAKLVRFVDRSGRVTQFPNIFGLAVYDDNAVQLLSMSGATDLSSGGTLFIDPLENQALFITDTNAEAVAQILENSPPLDENPSYSIETDEKGVRFLVAVSDSPSDTEPIQHITGSYTIKIDSSETLVYDNRTVHIQDFKGNSNKRIGPVDRFVADAGIGSSGSFNGSSTVPAYRGPGTLSINRGTAFYTTDDRLGRDIAFESSTAPIPDIDFEVVPMTVNEVEGINYTVATVIQTVGDDRVITYEATSYTTTPSQEILYSDNFVTVSSFLQVGPGIVEFNGGSDTITYRDINGDTQEILDINNFFYLTDSDIALTKSPKNRTVQGPGKLYVSEEGNVVLFRNSILIYPGVSDVIRRVGFEFSLPVDQFSSIYNGVYNFSTNSALVSLPGGGVIWSSTSNGSSDAFYIDNDRAESTIRRAVSSALLLTKSPPPKNQGIIRAIFNGREIYTYSLLGGSRVIQIASPESFLFTGTDLVGDSLPGGRIGNINMVVRFDGVEVKTVNTSMEFDGVGLLLVPSDSSKAFYTTSPVTANYLLQSIANIENFLISPQVEAGGGKITTKDREVTVDMGTDVTVYDGAVVTFVCNVRVARPEPSITFTIDGRVVRPPVLGPIVIINNTISLLSLRSDERGYEIGCIAENGVLPESTTTSTLTVLEAVAPTLQPGWFPFELQFGQKLISPSFPEVAETIDLREYKELIFACRVDGRPRAEVTWRLNEMNIERSDLPPNSYDIFEVIGGRSVLVFDLLSFFNETENNGLLGTNRIQCSADNEAGSSVTGTAVLIGEIVECGTPELSPETNCSATCGYGLRTNTFNCVRFTGEGMSQGIDIDDVPQRVVPLINRQRVCTARDEGNNIIICPLTEYIWNVSEWTDCSRTCGGGFQTRNVTCLSEMYPVDSRFIVQVNDVIRNVTEDMMCEMFDAAGERPANRQLCEVQDCPFWRASGFGECNATCGGGVRIREVDCVSKSGIVMDMYNMMHSNFNSLNETLCDANKKPRDTIDCNTHSCVFHWATGRFGPCGETALIGPIADEFPYCRERDIMCLDENGEVVDGINCDEKIRPSSLASCGGGRCFAGFWKALEFSDCSETCGYGVMTRKLQCLSPSTLESVPGDFCDVSIKPVMAQQCFAQNCPGMCLRDESLLCPILARLGRCDLSVAMGDNGLRCCVSCMGRAGGI